MAALQVGRTCGSTMALPKHLEQCRTFHMEILHIRFESPGCGRQIDEINGNIKNNATWNTCLRLLHQGDSSAMARFVFGLYESAAICNLPHPPPTFFKFGIANRFFAS